MTQALNIIPSVKELTDLHDSFLEAWNSDTTSVPDEWTEALPERGQCAVTALILQDIFGGELLRAVVNGESHYWNKLPLGEVDFTRSQFVSPLTIEGTEERTREYVLSNMLTVKRYETLKSRI